MAEFEIEVKVMPREGLLDPEGTAVQHALTQLGFEHLKSVRIGRAVRLSITSDSPERATDEARAMCEKLLANPVTEDFAIEVRETG